MGRKSSRITKRNEYLLERFRHYRYKNPKWTIIAVLDAVADDCFLEPATVARILKKGGCKVPSANTVLKYTQINLLF